MLTFSSITFSSIIATIITFMKPLSIFESSHEEAINVNTPQNHPLNESHKDIESANEPLSGKKEWEHIQDFAKAISLGGFGASITLIVNVPSTAAEHLILYTVYMAAACLGLFAALGLAFYAAKKAIGREVARMLERLMFFTLAFVAIACLIRLVFALPFQYLSIEFLCIFAVIFLVVVYLHITPDCKRRGDTDVAIVG